MVNAMDRSYADQSTLHGEDPMAVTFMDSHNYNNRCGLKVFFVFFFCPNFFAAPVLSKAEGSVPCMMKKKNN